MSYTPPHAVRKLGDILVDCRVVTQEQVDLALAEQRRSGKKLFGEALLDLGFISEDDLGWALSNQLNVPYIDLNMDMVDLGAVSLLGPHLMRRHRLLPLVRVGDALTVVLADPTNVEALTTVEEVTGLTVQASIASPRRIAQVLDEVLGAETRHDESSDLLFTEITRPSLSDGRPITDRSNPLGQLFSAALRDNVEEIHLEPAGDWVRVRFRRGDRLEDMPPVVHEDFQAIVQRFHENIPRAKQGSPEIPRWNSTVEFSAGVLELSVTLLPTPSGTGLVLELRKGRTRPFAIDGLGLTPSELETLKNLLNTHGLILVTGTDPSSRFMVLSALAGAVESKSRRVVAFGEKLSLKWDGLTHFMPPDRQSTPETIRADLYALRFIDVLLLDEVTPGADFDRAVAAAGCGKLILANCAGPDGLGTLAALSQQAASATSMASGLSAVIETTMVAPGTPAAALLTVRGPLQDAIERRVTRSELSARASEAGFRSLFDDSHPVRPSAGREASPGAGTPPDDREAA